MSSSAPLAVVIDRRPLWRILLERARKPMFFLVVGALFWFLVEAAPPQGLTTAGWRALLVFGLTVVLWGSGALPVAATSLMAIVLIPLLGVLDRAKTFALFGSETLFFIIGAFILSAAVMKTGLSTRAALFALRRLGSTPGRLLGGILTVAAVFSLILPQQVVATILFPILLEIARAIENEDGGRRYARGLFMGMAWGAVAGGVATLASAARNPLAVEIVRSIDGHEIGFGEWTLDTFPAVLLTVGAAWVALRMSTRQSIQSTQGAVEVLRRRLIDLGKVKIEERLTGLVVVATVFLWAFYGRDIGLGTIAVASAVTLFVLGVVGWRDCEHYVNWGIVLLLGGAIVVGAALHESGAARWIMLPLLSWQGSPLAVLGVIAAVAILLSEPVSGAAVVAALVPIGVSVARDLGLEPKTVAYAIAIPGGWGFIMPSGTAPLAIAYSSGYLRVRDMIVPGLFLDFVGWLAFMLMAALYWPLIGVG